eukprot:gene5224-5462_t
MTRYFQQGPHLTCFRYRLTGLKGLPLAPYLAPGSMPSEPSGSCPPPPQCPYTQLKQFYWMDFASVLPPLLLGPGRPQGNAGSSPGRLVCNELDAGRRGRLSTVLHGYLPSSLRRRVRVTGHDAAKHWSRFEGCLYDRVLLDAPCSSERHVVQQALAAGGQVAASSWSVERCRMLADLQLK